MSQVLKYSAFAGISTLLNLGTQWLVLFLYQSMLNLYVAMFFGTLVGLFAKYLLDKKYIFHYKTASAGQDAHKFILYSSMGIVTTLIYFMFEIGFHKMFKIDEAKYVGACLGLSIGYIIKYNLDKKFVFIDSKH